MPGRNPRNDSPAPQRDTGRPPFPPDPDTGAIVDGLRAFATSMNRYIDVRGGAAGMHRTDLYALAHVMDAERAGRQLTPSQLASALNLSSPATSALLARLEGAKHVRREHLGGDRRRVGIALTEQALTTGRTVFMPLALAIAQTAAQLSAQERAVVARFLADVVAATDAATDAASGTATDEPSAPRG